MGYATVLLADEHAIGAERLATLLPGHVNLVGIVGDGRQLLAAPVFFRSRAPVYFRTLFPVYFRTLPHCFMPLQSCVDINMFDRKEPHVWQERTAACPCPRGR